MTKLTPTQQALLEAAAAQAEISAEAYDPRSAASLVRRGFVISVPREGRASQLIVTAAGRAAIGLETEPSSSAGTFAQSDPPRAQPVTKAQTLIDLLRRPEGVTVPAMSEVTGWLPHSVRGFMAGHLKKKLGLNVTSEKQDGSRVYRIGPEA